MNLVIKHTRLLSKRATTAFSFSYNSTYTTAGLGKDDHHVLSLPPRGLVFLSGDEEAQNPDHINRCRSCDIRFNFHSLGKVLVDRDFVLRGRI